MVVQYIVFLSNEENKIVDEMLGKGESVVLIKKYKIK